MLWQALDEVADRGDPALPGKQVLRRFGLRAKLSPIKSAIHWAQARYISSFEPK